MAMARTKLLALAPAYLVWRVVPGPQANAVPIGLAGVAIVVAVWNLPDFRWRG